MSVKWGVLSTAAIATKVGRAIDLAENAELVAVASRSLERAEEWATEHGAERAYGSYEELLEDPDIEAVYIPLPPTMHCEWGIKTARAGKHVLSEKPLTMNVEEAIAMQTACRENNVQLMEGVMWVHHDWTADVKNLLKSGSIGDLRRVTSSFSFYWGATVPVDNIRAQKALGGGALGDLGYYTIRFTLWAMNYQLPERVAGRMLSEHRRPDSPGSVPTEFSAELFYPEGVSASFFCSFLTEHQQWANVSGTKGYLQVPDFVLPYHGDELGFEVSNAIFDITGCDFNMNNRTQRLTVRESSNSGENAQETNLFRNFAELVLSGKLEPRWGEITLKTQQVLDACLRSARSHGELVHLRT